MMGDKMITKEISIDSKNRIVLPSIPNYGVGDEIVFQYDLGYQIIFIYPYYLWQKKSNDFMLRLENDARKKIISNEEMLKLQRFYYSILSFPKDKVSSFKRVTLNKNIISKLDLKDSAFLVFDDNKIILCKDKDIYNQFKSKTGSR